MPTAQNLDTDRCRHIQAHIGTHTAHTVHIEAHGGITHTVNSQAEERTDLARVPILPSVFTKHEKDQFGEDGYFSSAVCCWDPTTMMEEEKKQETLDPHCETLPG